MFFDLSFSQFYGENKIKYWIIFQFILPQKFDNLIFSSYLLLGTQSPQKCKLEDGPIFRHNSSVGFFWANIPIQSVKGPVQKKKTFADVFINILFIKNLGESKNNLKK